jgi:translocation and assembly module TamB
MTQPNNPPPNTEQDSSRHHGLPILLKVGAGFGGLVLVGGIAAVIWGDDLINSQLIPWVETALINTFDRPIELGNLERLSWNGVRIGPSTLPPTDEVETGATVEAVNLSFNWSELLFNRTLRANLTFVEPDIDLVQALDGRWIDITLPDPEEDKTRNPIEFELAQVRVEDGQASIFRDIPREEALVEAEPILVENLDADIEFLSPNEQDLQEVLFEANGRIGEGEFEIKGDGRLEERAFNLTLQTSDLPTTGANGFLPPAIGIVDGTLNSNLTVELRSQTDTILSATRGTARLRNGQIQVRQLPVPITDIDTQLRFRGEEVLVEDTSLQLGDISLTAAGLVDLEQGYDLALEIPAVSIETVTELLETDLPIEAAGEFGFDGTLTGELDEPRLAGRLQNQSPVQLDEITLETLTAIFAASTAGIEVQTLRAVPAEGGFLTAEGQINLADLGRPTFDFNLQADLPGDAFASTYGIPLPNQVTLGPVQAQGQIQGTLQAPQANLQVQLPEATYPGSGDLIYRDNTLLVENAQFQVAQGTVDATATLLLDQRTWTAQLDTANVPLDPFTDRVQGLLTADLTAAGSLGDFSLQNLEASGTAQLENAALTPTPGAPSLLEPGDWTAAFQWVGDGIQLEQFSAPGVAASGFVATNFGQPIPIGPLDLDVQVSRYDISRFAQFLPDQVQQRLDPSWVISFDGDLTGPLGNLQIAGTAQVNDLALDTVAFEQQLTGPVDISLAEGGEIALRGGGDFILTTLNEDLLPSQFNIRLGETVAVGQLEDQQLTATVENVPIDAFGLAPAADLGLGPLRGTLDGTITADLRDLENLAIEGTATILDPALDTLLADQLEVQFTYGDNRLELSNALLTFNDSRYLLTGYIDLGTPTPEYYAQLDILSGNFQDLLDILNWNTFADIGLLGRDEATPAGAEALNVNAADLPLTTFLEQLKAFAQFLVRYEAEADETDIALPPLEDLRGNFSGTVTVQGDGFSADTIEVAADIQGQNWTWGPLLTCDPIDVADPRGPIDPDETVESIAPIDFSDPIPTISPPTSPSPPPYPACNQFTLAATYDQGTFDISPLLFQADDTRIAFVGDGSLENLNGQLETRGLPVELAELFVDIPVEADGELALMATLDGSFSNLSVVGDLAVIDPRLNQRPLESVALNFAYDNALLQFDGAVIVTEPAEVTLQGEVPYALPFMAVQPDTNQISIVANLENEGLQLLNLITDEQLRWEGGEGSVTLQVGGTPDAPAVVGLAEFQDGVLTSTALSQPVTDLTGTVRFNLERVQVEQLRANYGDGEIVVTGRLPIQAATTAMVAGTKQDAPPSDELAIALNQVNIDYEGFIEAQLDGQVLVGGAVLDPILSGTVAVGDGQVRPNEILGQLGASTDSDLEVPEDREADPDLLIEPVPKYIEEFREEVGWITFPGVEQVAAESPFNQVRLNNLNITLTDELLIVGQPFYYISASGDLMVDGTLQDLRPSGVITLDRGWINLFSTQFRLVANAANTATFYPSEGLDPFLDVEMRARVQETDVTRVVTNNPFTTAEISDNVGVTAFGQVEFVTVFATAYGYVSDLQDSETPSQAGDLITLTSRPSRSQEELLTLLGESVITNVYGASLQQLAGFFGSGALAGFGDRIASTIGLRSFSIFPTTDLATDSTAGIGIGVEASFQVGDRITVDALEILNSGNPPRVGVSYRFSDQLRTRATTNFSGDDTVSIEYEVRF